jgi:uncharacterized delta-60 repeat protein
LIRVVESAAVTTTIRRLRANVSVHRPLAFALALFAALLAPALVEAKPGDLDRSFGRDGTVNSRFRSYANSVAIDPRKRIVVAGPGFTLARYEPNGRLDSSFGTGGVVTTEFAGGEGHVASSARSVVIDSRRRIVAAGGKCYYQDSDYYEFLGCDFALARYKPNGSLDPSFGTGGKVTTEVVGDYPRGAFSVAIDSGGRIVAAGDDGQDFALARYNPDGSLDRSFGIDGKVGTDFGGDDYAFSVAIDSLDRIVAAGNNDYETFALARYHPDGSLDSSFGVGGKVTTAIGRAAYASSVVTRPGGRIVVAGGSDGRFALARYKPNGGLDRSFSHNGKVTTSFGDHPRDRATARSVAIDSRRRIVAAGGGFKLARYKPDGRLDRSFSRNGKVGTGVFSPYTEARTVAIDSRDRIVVGGGHTHSALARFIGYRRR